MRKVNICPYSCCSWRSTVPFSAAEQKATATHLQSWDTTHVLGTPCRTDGDSKARCKGQQRGERGRASSMHAPRSGRNGYCGSAERKQGAGKASSPPLPIP